MSAEVWKATVEKVPPGVELELNSEVAIKFYFHRFSGAADTIRIQREYVAASRIDHSGVVKVYDLVLAPSRSNSNFLVMEFIDGKVLKDTLPSDGLSGRDSLRIAIDLFRALGELHSHGVLHRDVKPANIILAADHRLTLLDLGIIQLEDGTGQVTGFSEFMGSKHYAPMEQLLNKKVCVKSDLYSAAATIYHCYTGKQPFEGVGNIVEISRKMQHEPLEVDLNSTKAEQDRSWLRLVNQCLKLERDDRPKGVDEILSILEHVSDSYDSKTRGKPSTLHNRILFHSSSRTSVKGRKSWHFRFQLEANHEVDYSVFLDQSIFDRHKIQMNTKQAEAFAHKYLESQVDQWIKLLADYGGVYLVQTDPNIVQNDLAFFQTLKDSKGSVEPVIRG